MAKATKRKKPTTAAEWRPPPGAVASVGIERNGVHVRFDSVPHPELGNMCRFLICLFDALGAESDAMIPKPDVVPGGSPIYVFEDEYAEEGRSRPRRRRVGFTPPPG